MLIARLAVAAGVLVASAAGAVAAGGAAPGPGPGIVRVNGVSIAIQHRVLDGEPGSLAARLQGRWGERPAVVAAAAASASASASRLRLGRQRGPFHETLTLSRGPRPGTSAVLIAVQDLRRPPAPPRLPPLTLPPGLKVVNVVEFGASRTSPAAFTLDSRAAPAPALAALGAAARRGAWVLAPAPRGAQPRHAAWARRAGEELAMVAIQRGAGTRITLLLTPVGAGNPR
jgi:hypothetical protein